MLHTKPGVAEHFIKDIQDATRVIMKDPKAKAGGQVRIYLVTIIKK